MASHIELNAVTIDCSDAGRLADFYADLTDGEVTYRDDESGHAQATIAGGVLNFQRVHSFTAPQWPGQEHAQQFHLDFSVGDLDAAVQRARDLGAMQAVEQPSAEHYIVMTDPDGHPFCLSPSQS
ncbi:MAG: VOC family protein [Arachnia sp.]